ASRRLLVIGAGEMASLSAIHAASRGCHAIVIANRDMDRGDAVACRVGGRAMPLDRLRDELVAADVVVSATAAPGFMITTDHAGSITRPTTIIDLAVPRDVDP